MSTKRFLLLTIGPVILILFSYWVTFEYPGISEASTTARSPTVSRFPVNRISPKAADNPDLDESCRTQAEALIRRLGEGHHAIVEAPFIIAGDLSEAELRKISRSTIQPILYALQRSYFWTAPDQPISLVMLQSVDSYRQVARKLDGYDALRYHGYFRREERRIVLDLSSGNGTLAHELTHALVAFDFPTAPEWFDEGLASLHEQGEFTEDGGTLIGSHNWRLLALKQALKNGQLKPLEELIGSEEFRQEGEGLQYAQVRYLCLYLQQRGLLKNFYHQFRDAAEADPHGVHTLHRLLEVETLSQFDEDFQYWLRAEIRRLAKAQR